MEILEFKNVDRFTRAGNCGRVIFCPECSERVWVYHFGWYALGCAGCKKMIKKTDYLTPTKKAKK